jgi:hypothetical protein
MQVEFVKMKELREEPTEEMQSKWKFCKPKTLLIICAPEN